MSNESFQEFVTTLQKDAGLQEEFRTRFGDPELGIPGEELAAFAAGKGYKFDVGELKGELSDGQLDAVNGGLFDVFQKATFRLRISQTNIFDKATPLLFLKWE